MQSRARTSPGFTLIELVLVIAMIGALASAVFLSIGTSTDAQKFDQTRRLLDSLKTAIVGDDSVDAQGHRTHFGYNGDMGGLPATLSQLTAQGAQPAWAFDATKGIGAGWRGPYINPDENNGLTVTVDAWGRSLVYSTSPEPASITSYGADGAAGGSLYDTDLVVQLPTTLRYATVSGIAHDGDMRAGGATINLWYPSAGTLTSAVPVTAAADGSFSFAAVPLGLRAMSLTSGTTTIGPNRIVVDTSPFQISSGSLDYAGKMMVTNGAVTLAGGNLFVDIPLTSTYASTVQLSRLTAHWNNTSTLSAILFKSGGTQTQNVGNVPSGTPVAISSTLTLPANSSATTLELQFTGSYMGNLNFSVTLEWNGVLNHDTLFFTTPNNSGNPPPTITTVTPNNGSRLGGGLVTITGTNFISGATVTIGGVACTPVTFVSSTTLTCTTGAHAPATVDVTVTNPDTLNATLTGGYTYEWFVFVADSGANQITTYALTTAGALTALTTTATGGTPLVPVLTSNSQYLYVSNEGSSNVQGYSINNGTGALTSLGTWAAGFLTTGITLTKNGSYLYASGYFASNVTGFSGPSGGALATIGTYGLTGFFPEPVGLAATYDSARLYVTANRLNEIEGFTIGGTGALTAIGTTWATAGTAPVDLKSHPTARDLYVTESGSNLIQIFTVNPGNGKLTSAGTKATGATPYLMAVDTTGTYLYVGNSGTNTVSFFTISGGGGTLSNATNYTSGGTGCIATAIDPTNAWVVVSNNGSGNVSSFQMSATGTLTLKSTTASGSDSGAEGLVIQ